MSLYRLTRAASTNQAAPSYLKLSTRCFVGIEGLRYAMPTWMTLALSRIRPRPYLHFEKVAGLLAVGLYRSYLHHTRLFFLVKTGRRLGRSDH